MRCKGGLRNLEPKGETAGWRESICIPTSVLPRLSKEGCVWVRLDAGRARQGKARQGRAGQGKAKKDE